LIRREEALRRQAHMAKNPRNYPDMMPSPESGRRMTRGEKLVSFKIGGRTFTYNPR
jgi:hypothetical protein